MIDTNPQANQSLLGVGRIMVAKNPSNMPSTKYHGGVIRIFLFCSPGSRPESWLRVA